MTGEEGLHVVLLEAGVAVVPVELAEDDAVDDPVHEVAGTVGVLVKFVGEELLGLEALGHVEADVAFENTWIGHSISFAGTMTFGGCESLRVANSRTTVPL